MTLNTNLSSNSVCEVTNEILLTQNQDISSQASTGPVVNIVEYDRQKLNELVSLHLKELLFKEVLKNNLENETKIKGYISINFINNNQNPTAIPERQITLQTLPCAIDKVTNLILANKNYNSYILPFVSNNGSAEQSNVMGGESLIIDLDIGNIDKKLKLITETFGTPSVVLKSGSIVDGKYSCRHIYYKFNEYLTGDKFKKLLDIRGKIAAGFGGDLAYQRNPAQLVRIFGTYNHNKDTKCFSEIEQNNLDSTVYNFDDFCVKADSYFTENPIIEVREKVSKATIDNEDISTIDFPIHQATLEITDGQVVDYLNALKPDVFEKGNYQLWLKALFATHHQYQGNEKGKEIFTEFSLQDNSRPRAEILDSINEHWKYSKPEKSNQKVTTFKTIIDIVNNKSFIDEELNQKPELGKLVKIFNDTLLYDETYVLTEKYLCIRVKLKGKNALPPYLQPICNYLKVLGGGNGSKGNSYRLIEYIDTKGKKIQNLLAVSLRGQELQTYLADINLQFNSKYYSLIQNYLLNSKVSGREVNIIHKTGWDEDKTTYSLSYKDGVKTFFVNKEEKSKSCYLEFGANPDEYLRFKGTLEGWKEITRLAKGNDNMIFALGLPFASMWLTPLGEAGRIINLFGRSQKGKSSLLSIASSVLGITIGTNKPFTSWSGTPSALENNCKIRNDSLLILDELHEADNNQTLIEAPYKICNGSGRARMAYNQTTNNNRRITTWSTLLFSSGERSYPDEMEFRKLSHYIKAGMMNRWGDYPAVTEVYGVYATIHEFENMYDNKEKAAEEFCKKLMNITNNNKGHAILTYLEYVFNTKSFDEVFIQIEILYKEWLDKYFYNNNPKINTNNSSQEMSVAKIFAISAAALSIACKAGVVDYDKDYVFEVLNRCYNKFLDSKAYVNLNSEERLMYKTLKSFLDDELQRGFYDNDNRQRQVGNKAYGIIHKGEYYLEVSKIESIFKGSNKTAVRKFLQENNYVLPNPNKKSEKNKSEKDFTFEIRHKGVSNKKLNFNLLNLTALGVTLDDIGNNRGEFLPYLEDLIKIVSNKGVIECLFDFGKSDFDKIESTKTFKFRTPSDNKTTEFLIEDGLNSEELEALRKLYHLKNNNIEAF